MPNRETTIGQKAATLLTLSDHAANRYAAEHIIAMSHDTTIAALAKYEDEIEALKQAGVHDVVNFYAEAGAGFAEHICQGLNSK